MWKSVCGGKKIQQKVHRSRLSFHFHSLLAGYFSYEIPLPSLKYRLVVILFYYHLTILGAEHLNLFFPKAKIQLFHRSRFQ